VADRLSLMNALFLPRDAWVLSGSVMSWGDPLIEKFDAVVFLTLAPLTRMARLERPTRIMVGSTLMPCPPAGQREVGTQLLAAVTAWGDSESRD
jgi:hypothetical protein